jgi:hypothetical protein
MCLLDDVTIVDGGTDAVQPREHDRPGPISRRVRQSACRSERFCMYSPKAKESFGP